MPIERGTDVLFTPDSAEFVESVSYRFPVTGRGQVHVHFKESAKAIEGTPVQVLGGLTRFRDEIDALLTRLR